MIDAMCAGLVWAIMLTAPASETEYECEIPVTALPVVVHAAALRAFEGGPLTEAEVVVTRSIVIYEVEGTLTGAAYEVRISPEGRILAMERDD